MSTTLPRSSRALMFALLAVPAAARVSRTRIAGRGEPLRHLSPAAAMAATTPVATGLPAVVTAIANDVSPVLRWCTIQASTSWSKAVPAAA